MVRVMRERLAGFWLVVTVVCVLADMLKPTPVWAIMIASAVAIFLFLSVGLLRITARITLAAAVIATVLHVALFGTASELVNSVRQAGYLAALIAVLAPLRMVAMKSPLIEQAGRHMVEGPPARRFLLVSAGAQVFGVLLNLGGLMLLLGVMVRGLDGSGRQTSHGSAETRSAATAAVRAFSAIVFWSPLGIGLNLMMTLVPGLSWIGFAPYGLAATIIFVAIGWLLDQLRVSPRPGESSSASAGDWRSLVGLVLVPLSISLAAMLLEILSGLPLGGALLMIVPLLAAGWHLIGPNDRCMAALDFVDQGLRTIAVSANEVAVISAASYLGLILASLIPEPFVSSMVQWLGLEHGALALAICIVIVAAALLGINPLISATVCVKAAVASMLDIAPVVLVLAALLGWALAMVVAPTTSTVTVTAAATGCPPSMVGIGWNSWFCVAVLGCAAAGFLAFG